MKNRKDYLSAYGADEFGGEVERWFVGDSSISSDIAYRLNDEQRQTVQEGRRQIADGEFVSNEKLEETERRWLKE